jgi:hypothetical protein
MRLTLVPHSAIRNPYSVFRIPYSVFPNPQSAIRDPRSAIRDPQSAIRVHRPNRMAFTSTLPPSRNRLAQSVGPDAV